MSSFKALCLALFAPTLIWGEVTTIHTCNADNCLRQVRSNSLKASPFCKTYIPSVPFPKVYPTAVTSYTSVRPTVFSVAGGSPSLITRKDAPYTPLNYEPDKRGLNGRAPDPTPAPEPDIKPRQAALPSFASSCTGDANRLSSACTCLIGVEVPTPTSTVARTIPGAFTTISVCGSGSSPPGTGSSDSYQYGLRDPAYGGYEFRHNKGQISGLRVSSITDLAGCCNKCFHTSRCTAYHLDPETSECEIDLLASSTKPTPEDGLCPAGLQEFYEPYQSNFNNSYALGLCAYLVPSDE